MSQNPPPASPTQPVFDPSAGHQQRPRLRPVRGFPVQAQTPDGQAVQMLGLADARQIASQVVVTAPAAQLVLPKLDGTRDLDQVVQEVGRGLPRQFLEGLVAQLDHAGLLEGPTFQAMLDKVRADFDAAPNLPPAATAAFVDALLGRQESAAPADPGADEAGVRKLREFFDQCIERALEKAERPSLDQLPRGIIAPHLDYGRGWINYAAVYGRLRVVDRPDRVVILGTNHFGQATGVCGCDKGFTTPLGTCAADQELIGLLRAALGEKLFADRFDHEREHSVELQVPWVQHVFGKDAAGNFPRVFAALVHDPAVSGGESYDGNGIALDPFVQAMKKAISELPGRTLVISSADLSHVGSSFGDQTPVAGDDPKAVEFRNKVVKHDQEMLQLVLQRKPAELVATLSWLQNPTRWCSLGNLVAAMLIADPAEVEIFNYGAALDQQGLAMVSSVAAALK